MIIKLRVLQYCEKLQKYNLSLILSDFQKNVFEVTYISIYTNADILNR